MIPLADLIERLAGLALEETQRSLLEEAAERVQTVVRESLSRLPGESHEAPWLREGALRDSIDISIDADSVVVGTDHPAAAAQELGTSTLPPRPFLGPAAGQLGEPIADSFGAAFAALLRGEEPA